MNLVSVYHDIYWLWGGYTAVAVTSRINRAAWRMLRRQCWSFTVRGQSLEMVTLYWMLGVVGDHSLCTLHGSIETARWLGFAIQKHRKRILMSDAGNVELRCFSFFCVWCLISFRAEWPENWHFCRELQLENVEIIVGDISTFEMEGSYDRIFSIEMFEVKLFYALSW